MTKLFIQTFMCPLGIGNPSGECRFHRSADNLPEDMLCPIHKLPLEKTTDENDKISVTILEEKEVDSLILHGDKLVTAEVADEIDSAEISKAAQESKSPQILERKPIPEEEKTAMKEKIAADIIKFSALEDK